jgi:hypothetical protein
MELTIMVFGNTIRTFVGGRANFVDSIRLVMCIACFMHKVVLL